MQFLPKSLNFCRSVSIFTPIFFKHVSSYHNKLTLLKKKYLAVKCQYLQNMRRKKNDKILIFPDLYALKILESFKN